MAPDPEIVRDRIHRIRRYVKDLDTFSRISKEDFLQNTERQYAVLHALQLAIEASVEIAMHICSADGLGVPATYAEAFVYLRERRYWTLPLPRISALWRGSEISSFTHTPTWTSHACTRS